MFTPASARAALNYRQTNVDGASPYQLINLLFDGLLLSLRSARASLARGDTQAKCDQLGKAVRFIEEGLKLGLDSQNGGELAANLRNLYDYCVRRVTFANLRNEDAPIAEVIGLIESVAEGWRGIGGTVNTLNNSNAQRPALAVGA